MENPLFNSNFINVNGLRLHYLDWDGDGPALLFLAGMGATPTYSSISELASVTDSTCWR